MGVRRLSERLPALRDGVVSMSGPIACAHCGETKSWEGFLRVVSPGLLGGVFVAAGSDVRVECCRAAGVYVPDLGPLHVFRVQGDGP
jgi:hypothetical protein